jgi:hypothetical protein
MDDYNNEDFYETEEDFYEPEEAVDEYYLQAQEDIRGLYEKNKGSVYFIRQLQVKFEKKYFHWVTNNALTGLFKIGYLKDVRIPKEKGTSTRFFIHHSNRYAKREINRMEKVIEEYSQSHITRSCGYRAEDLFCKGLALRGFLPVGPKVREYKGKKWQKTDHDLDFIFIRDGIEWGCEIKNKLGYIEKEELGIKLEMCAFWGIRPLFIMRYSPKTYNNMIYRSGGFALIFETQIYELSQEDLVKRIREVLGLPVDCPKAIPGGIIDRFDKWDKRKKDGRM